MWFRRGATSEARARGTDKDDVDLANRWRTFEGAKGKRPRMAMRDFVDPRPYPFFGKFVARGDLRLRHLVKSHQVLWDFYFPSH
jgi:hypothetical protein